jgi:peptidoglycan-associated lipoprotein
MRRQLFSRSITLTVGTGALALLGVGCATRGYVNHEVESAQQSTAARISEVQTQVEQSQGEITALHQTDAQQSQQLTALSDTARDALKRAQEAGVLAKGKFLYEVNLRDDSVQFPVDSADLTPADRAVLDALAQRLKTENRSVYVEVQGHTDSTGPVRYNLRLGEERAEAVRRYLSEQHGIPLNRINVVSYGPDKPVAENATREGRAANRRVSIVVLS